VIRIGVEEAKLELDQLVERALAGEDVVLTQHGEPAVRLVAERQGHGFASLYGVWCGRVRIAGDFDRLPEALAARLGDTD
jgi:prevent-host-death family protein